MATAKLLLVLTVVTALPSTPWPLPFNLTRGGTGNTSVSPTFSISCDPSPSCTPLCTTSLLVASGFARYTARMRPLPPPSLPVTADPSSNFLYSIAVCVASDDETLGPATDESYILSVPSNGTGTLNAPTVFGMLHGLESLAHLLDVVVAPGSRTISQQLPVFIDDRPRFPYRGLLVDSGRHFLPVAQLLHTIDAMAYSKLNVLHWHIVDDTSFPCGSDAYPALAAKGAYDPTAVYTPDDLRAVVAYGLARGVRILPEWDIPGHGDWGGVPGVMGCPIVLDPTVDATYDMLRGFLSEMASIFIEPWMFLGGDEVQATCWDQNPAIAAWLVSHNMTSAQLQQYFWLQMQLRVIPHLNKTVGVWEDNTIQIDLSSLPSGSFVNVYGEFATANRTTSQNKTTVVSLSGNSWYLDITYCNIPYAYHQNQWECAYDVPLFDKTWSDMQRSYLLGGEAAMWGEGINADNADAYIWRGAAAIAERLWSDLQSTPSHQQAAGRLAEHLCRLGPLGVRAGAIGPNFCPSDTGMGTTTAAATAAMEGAVHSSDGSVMLSPMQAAAVRQALQGLV
jgi:hexosaminidase